MDEIKKNQDVRNKDITPSIFSPRVVGILADEVAKTMASRLPHLFVPPKKPRKKNIKKIDSPIILDTSAIIDRRIFDLFRTGLVIGNIILFEEVLLELKHIADSQDAVRREKGRKGLIELESLKKVKNIKLINLTVEKDIKTKKVEVDEKLILLARKHKGRILTCDYNLEKKASIQNITAINVNALANSLKITAVPGEAVHIRVLHQGKESMQGVGYLDDGTMIVVENGKDIIGQDVDVVVSRVIQTASGRILFSKRI